MGETFRADVVGSMIRPPDLLRARARHDAGELDADELRALEDRAVDEALRIQEAAAVDVVTDGEMRRFVFTGPLTEAVRGIEAVPTPVVRWRSDAGETSLRNPVCVTGRLERSRYLALEEYAYARTRTRKPLKVTLPSPLMLALFWSPEHSTVPYPDPFDAFADAAALVKDEARRLIEAGCRYLQIDAPELATLVDPVQRAHYAAIGVDPDRMLGDGMDLLNGIAELPGATWGIHFCRGNNDGQWMSSGGYEAIAGAFGRASNYDVLLLEYDTDRAGDFAPLAGVPDDKVVVLGLISTKTDVLEPQDDLLARIDEAGAIFPRDQLALSTQCGFSSGAAGNPIAWETQRRKLGLVSEVAARAW